MSDAHGESEYSSDFDFRHHLYDTIILLGGRKEIADLVKKSMDAAITGKDIDAVKRYNVELVAQAKDRLAHINKLKVSSVAS